MLPRRNWLFPLGVVGGILIGNVAAAPVWTVAGAILLAVQLRRGGRLRFLVLFLLGVAAGWLAAFSSARLAPDHIARFLRHHPRRAEARFRIADHEALGTRFDDAAEELQSAPTHWNAEILAIRFDHEKTWRPASGKVTLRFAAEQPSHRLGDGEIIECAGRFFPPAPPTRCYLHRADGCKDAPEFTAGSFAAHRQAHGIAADFLAESDIAVVRPAAHPGARWRSALRSRIVSGITDPEHRAELAALTLGLRGELPSKLKQRFRQSGLAHLFSVSGLHVGILAMLILLFLRPLPLPWRTLTLVTLVPYVWITGGNAPALRAFLLLVVLAAIRSQLYWLRALEVLALIGTGLLLWRPAYLFDAGFQYSFVITGFLILAAQTSGEVAAAARGPVDWQPDAAEWRKRLARLRGSLAAALFIAITASLSGAMLSLHHQHHFFPWAWLVNLLVLPILSPIFLLALGKCVLPELNAVWNGLLHPALDYLNGVPGLALEWESNGLFLIPGWGAVIGYGVLLALALRLRTGYGKLAAILGVPAILGFYALSGGAHAPLAAIVTGGSSTSPLIALLHPGSREMTVFNAPREGVYALNQLAEHCRIRQINLAALAPNRAETARGLSELQKRFAIREIHLPEEKIRSAAFRDALCGLTVRAGSGATGELRFGARKQCWFLQSDGMPPARIRVEKTASGRWEITVNSLHFTVPAGSVMRIDLAEVR